MEFWEDRIVEPMAVIGRVLDPIIENALERKGEKKVGAAGNNLEGETLLSHLVKLTDGEPCFHTCRYIQFSLLCLSRSQDHPRRNIQYHDCRKGHCAFDPLSMGRCLTDDVALS